MKASGAPRRVWRAVRWPLLVIVALFVAYVAYGMVLVYQKDRDDTAVAAIHAQKLTLADVQGVNLPPVPNQIENDATVAGVDKNNNGIRDDVELAIFKKYPGTANQKIRAAELQYAMTEQMFLTRVFDTATWKAVAEEDGRASSCIGLATPAKDIKTFLVKIKEVENLTFNTSQRNSAKDKVFDYTTSFGDAPGVSCDVSL